MLKCKEIVRILSSDEPLSFLRKAELKMHLAMCGNCSRYAKHLNIMQDSFIQLFKKKTAVGQSEVKQLEDKVLQNLRSPNRKGDH